MKIVNSPNEVKDYYDVIVVGAGFSGVVAARDLSQAGKTVLVVEARDRIGGRTWYKNFPGTTQGIEMGGTWVYPPTQVHVMAEVERYNHTLFDSPSYDRFSWALNGGVTNKPFPIPIEEWSDLERAIVHINNQAARIRFGKEPLGQIGLKDLEMPFEQFVNNLDLPKTTRDLLLAYATFYFGAYPKDLSAIHALSWVAGFGDTIGFYTKLTGKIVNGTKSLIEAISDDSSADLLLSTPVDEIDQSSDVVLVKTRSGQIIKGASLILATPINTWSSVKIRPALMGSYKAMAEETQAGQSVKVWVKVRGRHSVYGTGVDSAFKWIATEYHVGDDTLLCGFSMRDELDPEDKVGVTRAIHELFPDLEVLEVEGHNWNTDEFSQGTWMAYRSGQVMAHSANLQNPNDRIVFAGSDTASAWAGWIDGAVESGKRAALQVDKIIKQKAVEINN